MLAQRLEFSPERDAEAFAAVPATPAVFLLRSADPAADPYATKTANLRRRLQRLLGASSAPSRKLNLRDRVRSIEYTSTGSDFESALLLYRLLRESFPRTYTDRLRFRFAPLIKLHLSNPYPRASVTSRLGRANGSALYYGPFASRAAAERFANDSLDFFKMRRCVDDLHPDPAFPGCIYSEMKMCLAPCFKGCSDSDYAEEVNRVRAYLDSGGHSLVREIEVARDDASGGLDFEAAAAFHARLEKLKPVTGQLPEIVRRLDRLTAVIVQRSATPDTVALFRVDGGCIAGPATFSIAAAADHTRPQSMESRVEETLAEMQPATPSGVLATMEQLAILKSWYYRGSRTGEIFLADDKGNLPLRRLVRGISRVYRGEKEIAPQAPTDVSPGAQ